MAKATMNIEIELRPIRLWDKRKGLFHRWCPTTGRAIIETENGLIGEYHASQFEFLDSSQKFREYLFEKQKEKV